MNVLDVGVVRLDDLVEGVGWQFSDPVQLHVATHVDEVESVLAAADAAARRGRWAVGFVGYEAAPAFDRAFPLRHGTRGLPLACFAEFASRSAGPVAGGIAHPTPIEEIERAGGSEWFTSRVEWIRQRIACGDVYQVNLTDRLMARSTAEPFDLYRSMIWSQAGAYNAYIDLGDFAIVSASPELFFTFDGTVVTTKPMKGTAARRPRLAEDVAAGQELVRSEKDRAENVMIVDLLRNDLSRVARLGGVTVPSLCELERYETVWQLTSTVRAEVRPGTTVIDVMRALFPCGSVTGAPKLAATKIIDELEPFERGVYCGAIGFIGPSEIGSSEPTARFNVAIRTAVVRRTRSTIEYGAGGGITWGSDPLAEDAELVAKAAVLTSARPPFDLFETLLIDGDGPRHVELHLRRLAASATYFGFTLDQGELCRAIAALARPTAPHRLRIVLNRTGTCTVSVSPLQAGPSIVRLGVASLRIHSDDPFVCHKTTNRTHYDRARAELPDADDAILVNQRSEVVETTIASILYRQHDRWFTPPLSSGGLDGIGRRILLESGAITERRLPLDELDSCDEIAVVSSLRGRRPAVLQR